VIANRANELLGGQLGAKEAGASERSRQSQPVVERQLPEPPMHIAAAIEIDAQLAPSPRPSACSARRQSKRFARIVKIGRTHLQDATPLTLGQEFSGYAAQVASGNGAGFGKA